jgi:hypothetical protein
MVQPGEPLVVEELPHVDLHHETEPDEPEDRRLKSTVNEATDKRGLIE